MKYVAILIAILILVYFQGDRIGDLFPSRTKEAARILNALDSTNNVCEFDNDWDQCEVWRNHDLYGVPYSMTYCPRMKSKAVLYAITHHIPNHAPTGIKSCVGQPITGQEDEENRRLVLNNSLTKQ